MQPEDHQLYAHCHLCSYDHNHTRLHRHIASCLQEFADANAGAAPSPHILLKLSITDDPYHFLYLLAHHEATLRQLHQALTTLWLHDCRHPTHFAFEDCIVASDQPDDGIVGWDTPVQAFSLPHARYECTQLAPTPITIIVEAEAIAVLTSPHPITVVARNSPPDCVSCSDEAATTWSTAHTRDGAIPIPTCDDCAAAVIAPIANSPCELQEDCYRPPSQNYPTITSP